MHRRQLKTVGIDTIDELITPGDSADITLDSKAVEIFTDFETTRPLVIDDVMSADQAETLMRRTHVKLKLVVDAKGSFLGTVSYDDLIGDRFKRLIAQHIPPADVTVRQLMSPRVELRALSYADLERATIGDVVACLRQERRQHFLVVDTQRSRIRGLVSASDIARRLHISIDIAASPSFADICHAMSMHHHPTGGANALSRMS